MSRSIEPERGRCESCGKTTIVYDLMGDVLCQDCAFPKDDEDA